MNITAFEYEDTIVVVDCGLAFPTDDMLGIDLVIPDVTYLERNIDKVKGFVITHGHEDHIGALPYILQKINVPVYGTKLTIALIENKLKEHNLMKSTKRKVVKHGQSVNLGCFRVEFIKTNHSIADSAALALFTPAGIIVHTGDFKVDYTPVFGDAFDLARFAELSEGFEESGGYRIYDYREAFNRFLDHPLLGNGFGYLKKTFIFKMGWIEWGDFVHCLYLEILFKVGISGVLCLLVIFEKFIKRIWRYLKWFKEQDDFMFSICCGAFCSFIAWLFTYTFAPLATIGSMFFGPLIASIAISNYYEEKRQIKHE